MHRTRAPAPPASDKTQVDPNFNRPASAAAAAAAAAGDRTQVDPNFNRPATAATAGGDKTQADPNSPLGRAGTGSAAAANKAPATEAPHAASAGVDGALALPLGYRLQEYRIDRFLGQGGFGITYLATDVNLNAKVAVKEYLPEQFALRDSSKSVSPRSAEDQEFYQYGLDSFLIEARTLATFRHPNIVRVARFFEANTTAYMVLEYERGESLKNWWRKHSDIAERDLLNLLLPLLDGLGVVHRSGILHRDIKPDNIYVRDEDGSLVLLDFGAARQAAAKEVELANIVTPGYGPIEQYFGGNQGPWTDLYALGATLYWMVAGTKPPEATHRTGEDRMEPAVDAAKGRFSPEFLRAIDWALKPQPEDRPQDVQQFAEALFGAHASALGLVQALAAGGDADEGIKVEDSWAKVLTSPRLMKARLRKWGRTLFRPASWPIALKMTLAMVSTALFPMLITAYYNWSGSVERVSQGELKNLEQLAQSLSGRVSQLLDDTGKLANYIGTDRDFVSYLVAPTEPGAVLLRSKLGALLKANTDLQLVMVFDAEGNAKVASDPQVQGRNFKFREYFQVAMTGKPFITTIIVGAVAGANGVFFSHPVRAGADDRVIGAVVIRLLAKPIETILEQARVGNERLALMVDEDGILIYHPDPRRRFSAIASLKPEILKEIIDDQRFRRDKIETVAMPELSRAIVRAARPGNVVYQSALSGQAEIAGYSPVKGTDWVVAASESREAFSRPLDQLFENVLYIVVLVGAIFLLFAMLFARSIVKPIEDLNGAAHALKSGDYDKATMKVTSNDEIGQLSRTFNVMIDVLRQRERERSSLGKRAPADAAKAE